MGMSLPYSSTMAAEDDEKRESTIRSSQVLAEAVKNNLTPRKIMTRKAFENAIAVVMATGGSTNAVLHLLAIAHSAGVDLKIEDFETIRHKVPVLCDLKPSGKYVATNLHRVGGIPLVMKMLLENGILHGDCLTITGKTIEENLRDVSRQVPDDQDVVRPFNDPLYAEGHLAILRGNLAEDFAWQDQVENGAAPAFRRRVNAHSTRQKHAKAASLISLAEQNGALPHHLRHRAGGKLIHDRGIEASKKEMRP